MLGNIDSYKLNKRCLEVKNCRNIGKNDMKLNDLTPVMKVDPESYQVEANGELMTVEPSETLPMTKQFNIF